MGETQIVDVCKVTTTTVEDFDEAISVVQVHIGKFRVRDVLLDGESGVNIISKSLRKKLGLRKPKLAPFVVKMANHRKAQFIGLIRNLEIDLLGCEYKSFVTMLNMGNETKNLFNAFGKALVEIGKGRS